MPALHHIKPVEQQQEGQRDVDVPVRARAVVVDQRVAAAPQGGGEVGGEADLGDPCQLTPSQRSQAADHEDGEQQAAPVGLPADAGAQGLLGWTLLQRQEKDKQEP